VFVPVPRAGSAAVLCGTKREFRAACGKHSALLEPPDAHPGCRFHPVYGSPLMVLESVSREPRGAISAESLSAEGFASFADGIFAVHGSGARSGGSRFDARRLPDRVVDG
jgi:hypothetical protein